MKKFTLLACAIMSVAMAPAAELEYSYNPNGLDPQWYGTSKKENYDIAVKIDNPGLAGARITSISVPVNGADNLYGSASAFLTSKLVVERIDGVRVNVPDICSVEATISNGILTATFDEPYTLTSEPIYVGYSIEVAELQTDTKAPIAVVAGDNPDGFWFHSTRTQLKWDNYVNKDKAGLQSAMSIMLDGNFDAATASISLPERTLMITNQENEYSFEVINGGVTEISNVGYSWKIGDISGEGTYEFPTPVRNAIGASGTVSFTVPAVEENGKNKISITLDKVNGSANPNLSASDEANVGFTPSVPVNRPLVEEYTGMWCGWCVRGYVALEHLREVYGEDFVAAAWHNTDPVAISSAYPNAVSGFPMAYINRSLSLDPGNLGIFWPEAAEALTDISIECDIEYTDNTKSAIKATATVTSIEDDNTPYYIGYLLIGDGLQDPSWLQSNYYSGRTAQAEAELAEPYAKMFAEMPSMAGGLTFNDVTLSKDYAMGVDGSLPQKGLKAFSPESHSITFDISDIRTTYIRPTNENPDANLIPIDKNKLRVIAFVLRTDGTVVNSCSSPYTDGSTHASGVETIVSDAEVARIVWHDLQGHTVSAPEKGRIYVCTHIMTDGTVRSSKVIVK